jgi:hypothetical protein
MRVNQIIEGVSVWSGAEDALTAVRHVAQHDLPALAVYEPGTGRCTVLGPIELLELMLPWYVRESPALANVYDEPHADALAGSLAGVPLAHAVRLSAEPFDGLPADATLVRAAQVMAWTRWPVVPVQLDKRSADTRSVPVVTAGKLLRVLCQGVDGQRSSRAPRTAVSNV